MYQTVYKIRIKSIFLKNIVMPCMKKPIPQNCGKILRQLFGAQYKVYDGGENAHALKGHIF